VTRRSPWLRFLRLVVACLAFLVVRPPPCAADTIAVRATVSILAASLETETTADDQERLPAAAAAQEAAAERPPGTAPSLLLLALAPRNVSRAIVTRKYLRHRALLC
jgi:hypothetical protein